MPKIKKKKRGRPAAVKTKKHYDLEAKQWKKKKVKAKEKAPKKSAKKPSRYDLVSGRFCIGSALTGTVWLDNDTIGAPSTDIWPKVFETRKLAEIELGAAQGDGPTSDGIPEDIADHADELTVYPLKKFFANSYVFALDQSPYALGIAIVPRGSETSLKDAQKEVRLTFKQKYSGIADTLRAEKEFLDDQVKEAERIYAQKAKELAVDTKAIKQAEKDFEKLVKKIK